MKGTFGFEPTTALTKNWQAHSVPVLFGRLPIFWLAHAGVCGGRVEGGRFIRQKFGHARELEGQDGA
jgi:hypothetical protein